jgi:hypothetical protein
MKLELPSLYLNSEPVARKLWATTNEYPFLVDGVIYTIPQLFVCDKYSVPLGVILKRERKENIENIPAILHDYLVRYRKVLGFSITDCHSLFRQAMLLCGLGFGMRWTKWSGVFLFNWAIATKGDGTPPRNVKRFIDKHGYGC